jgi:hypothetical protein
MPNAMSPLNLLEVLFTIHSPNGIGCRRGNKNPQLYYAGHKGDLKKTLRTYKEEWISVLFRSACIVCGKEYNSRHQEHQAE